MPFPNSSAIDSRLRDLARDLGVATRAGGLRWRPEADSSYSVDPGATDLEPRLASFRPRIICEPSGEVSALEVKTTEGTERLGGGVPANRKVLLTLLGAVAHQVDARRATALDGMP
jgi:hypothetical protein